MGHNKRGHGGVGRHWTHGTVPIEQVTAGVDAKHSRRVRREAQRRGISAAQVAAEQMQRGEKQRELAECLAREAAKDHAIEVLQKRARERELLLKAMVRKFFTNGTRLTQEKANSLMREQLLQDELDEKRRIDKEKEAERRQQRYYDRKARDDALAAEPSQAHETLGVKPDASEDVIKAAYRALCKEHHPDKGGSADKFREIRSAYESLIESKQEAFAGA